MRHCNNPRITQIVTVTALWTAVALGAVLGRILDPPTNVEVFSSHPEIEREQLASWGKEFFQPPFSSYRHTPSRTEFLEHFPRARSLGQGPSYTLNNNRVSSNSRHYEMHGVGSQTGAVVKPENLEWMLNNIFMYPRNHNTNESAKEAAKKYILDSFQLTSGLQTALQHFQPLQFLNIYEGYPVPHGTNVIGILQGREWGTPNDHPVLVGAHWDTVAFTPGTDDNGSGTAAMLETARAIAHSECSPKHSIIFVAFDLEEVGSQGSLLFIKDFLSQILKTESPHDLPLERFQGAWVMDTIMNFNDTDGSQTFPREWSLLLPDVYDIVADGGYRGDFLSMIYRKNVDNRMAERFSHHWAKKGSNTGPNFRLQPFPLDLGKELPEVESLADHLNFLRSDHSRFWYMNDSAITSSLNAILMTDTGPYRGKMRDCYHTVCDGPEVSVLNNPSNLKFLTKITQVLTDTLVEMSECEFRSPSSTSNTYQNFINSNKVHARSSTSRQTSESPLRNLLNFVRWMEIS